MAETEIPQALSDLPPYLRALLRLAEPAPGILFTAPSAFHQTERYAVGYSDQAPPIFANIHASGPSQGTDA